MLPYATATKVLTKKDKDGKLRALGVRVQRFGETLDYFSKKETVLSSGAIGSPHLLLLSGIGPADHLKSVGVKVVKDLPGVGKNLQVVRINHVSLPFITLASLITSLQDHIMTMVPFYTSESSVSTSPIAILNPLNWLKLVLGGGGTLTDNSLGTHGMIRTKARL